MYVDLSEMGNKASIKFIFRERIAMVCVYLLSGIITIKIEIVTKINKY